MDDCSEIGRLWSSVVTTLCKPCCAVPRRLPPCPSDSQAAARSQTEHVPASAEPCLTCCGVHVAAEGCAWQAGPCLELIRAVFSSLCNATPCARNTSENGPSIHGRALLEVCHSERPARTRCSVLAGFCTNLCSSTGTVRILFNLWHRLLRGSGMAAAASRGPRLAVKL